MTSTLDTARVDDTLAQLHQAVDALRALDVEALSSDEVLALLRGIETEQQRLVPVQHAAIGQVETRSLAFAHGAKNSIILLTMMLRITRAEAGRRVAAARLLGPRRTVTGAPVEPQFPVVAAAQADGVISPAHAKVITDLIGKLPSEVLDTRRTAPADPADPDAGADVDGCAAAQTVGDWLERYLTGQARTTDPQQLERHGRQLCEALDQDGLLREYRHRIRARSFDLHVRADGSSCLRAELTPEVTAHLLTHLDVFARPAPATTRNTGDRTDGAADGSAAGSADASTAGSADGDADGDAGGSSTEGERVRDTRTATQRRHDAFGAMLLLLEQARLLGDRGGVTATLVLIMDAEVYATSTPEHSTGLATTGHGYQIPAGKAKTWLGPETRAIAVLLSKTKGIEAYSNIQRLATEQQRLAILARDRGCFAAACDTPPLRTETHHLIAWKDGGRTSVDNLGLLCHPTHDHFEQAGYTTTMINGRPWMIPPPWIDPEQKPVRNTLYD